MDPTTVPGRKVDYGRSISKPLTCKTYETPKTTQINSEGNTDNVIEKCISDGRNISDELSSSLPLVKNEPPPLPPKPKYFPQKILTWDSSNCDNRMPVEITNRETSFLKPGDSKRDSKILRSRRTIYLEQPSSSFV